MRVRPPAKPSPQLMKGQEIHKGKGASRKMCTAARSEPAPAPHGGRIPRLIATTALAHPQTARGSHSPAKAADAVRLQHGLLRALYGFLPAPARIVAATASTGGPRKKM
ncbi:hypothetical protein NDU88_000543 [Pleurodeles waltl]|uniref:Uncharacterized protein n=1 Tax=Pleurodeles waltl TaxID=8319 RepID=A0AAV7V784_PLEWA|nr:hypothetical protein NDU88_000543 [Pleurodeles waltl]